MKDVQKEGQKVEQREKQTTSTHTRGSELTVFNLTTTVLLKTITTIDYLLPYDGYVYESGLLPLQSARQCLENGVPQS